MKTLLLAAVMACVAIATAAPPALAQTADDTEAAAIARALRATNTRTYARTYAKTPYRARRYARTPRNAAQARAWQVARYAGTKKLQLPEYKPYYTGGGSYIPTTFIYQQTNGEFKILRPTTGSKAPTTGQQGGVNAALRNIGRGGAPAAATNAARPQPPAPPVVRAPGNAAGAPAAGNASSGNSSSSGDSGGLAQSRAAADNNTSVPRVNFP